MTDVGPTWLHELIPGGDDRARHLGGRLLDVTAAVALADNDDEATALSGLVDWGAAAHVGEVTAVATTLLGVAVLRLAAATDLTVGQVISELRAVADGGLVHLLDDTQNEGIQP
ncbi:hypothetical protein [Kineosporia sp. A_224]|uniref:hypothetical protein n=1 Tax=Kineosporia sp. A_224 TaxID=1962180 RepID=UPI000B4AAF3B|nr:hypothetical protein [Kineosporia sp. A_224]